MYMRMKFERHSRNWTQADLANHPEVRRARPLLDQSAISMIETGRLNPTTDQLNAIARAFKITPAHVLLKECAIADPEETREEIEVPR